MSEQDSTPAPRWETDHTFEPIKPTPPPSPNAPGWQTILKHLGLFIITFFTVSLAGAGFVGYGAPMFPFGLPTLTDFGRGALYAALLLGFLGVHEFGHYFASVYHQIKVTLPYFIPIPLGIGTVGAVIRIRQRINHAYQMFDVGAAGPIAGFIVAIGVLLVGFFKLPDPSYIMHFQGHEAIKQYVQAHGSFPDHPVTNTPPGTLMVIGHTLLYSFLAHFFSNVPPMWEMYHYPFLFAGWLGLFFTALNLTPVGQLDGGHILYSLIGFKKHRLVARIFFGLLVTLAGMQAIPTIHLMLGSWDTGGGTLSIIVWAAILFLVLRKGYRGNHRWIAPVLVGSLVISVSYLFFYVGSIETPGSLIWVVWSFFLAFFAGVEHPPALHEQPLSTGRKVLGWSCMVIFLLCISPNPIYLI